MSQELKVRPVLTAADRKAFLDLPFRIYANDVNWVPPLYAERNQHLDPGQNPFFRHADLQLFLAERGGVPVGRVSAQIDHLYLDRYHDATGHFGFIEAVDDAEVFKALLAMAEHWLRARGMKRMRGPFSFSINDETGLLIDGFDHPPNVLMGHHAPYYAKHFDALGYAKAKDVIAYLLSATKDLPKALQRAYLRALATPAIEVRSISKRNLRRDIGIILDIHSDAWADNWGFVPFTPEELNSLADNLKWLVREPYVAIANFNGRPAAMAVTLPNVNDWIKDMKGRLLPLGWAKLLWNLARNKPRSVRMVLMGVRREYHNTLVGSSLALSVIETLRRYHIANGTTAGELSWILEDNLPMRHIIELLGGVPYKTYRVYEKML
jgi:hypothetical protein